MWKTLIDIKLTFKHIVNDITLFSVPDYHQFIWQIDTRIEYFKHFSAKNLFDKKQQLLKVGANIS